MKCNDIFQTCKYEGHSQSELCLLTIYQCFDISILVQNANFKFGCWRYVLKIIYTIFHIYSYSFLLVIHTIWFTLFVICTSPEKQPENITFNIIYLFDMCCNNNIFYLLFFPIFTMPISLLYERKQCYLLYRFKIKLIFYYYVTNFINPLLYDGKK